MESHTEAHSVTNQKQKPRGTWVAQSVNCLTLAQVMISEFVGLSPASGSVLTVQSLEPASNSVSPSVSASPPPSLCLCLSLKTKNKKTNKHTKAAAAAAAAAKAKIKS